MPAYLIRMYYTGVGRNRHPLSSSIHPSFLFLFIYLIFFARQTMLVTGEQILVVCPVAVDSCELYGELGDSLYAQ